MLPSYHDVRSICQKRKVLPEAMCSLGYGQVIMMKHRTAC